MVTKGTYDRTFLRENRDGYKVHRDYAAHYFRWGWAVHRSSDVSIVGRSVLDIGCGPDLPLINVAGHASQLPASYVGVDMNKLDKPLMPAQTKRVTLYPQTDFTLPETWQLLLDNHGKFNRILCFECIEHMPVERGWHLLWGARQLLTPAGEFYLSTPVFNGKAARNHVHEYEIEELAKLIDAAGFEVVHRYGTFANVRESKDAMAEWYRQRNYDPAGFEAMWESLSEFHSPEVLATYVAPLIPDASRNNLWRLRLKESA